MQVASGGAQVIVTQELLDRVQIYSCFQQVRGEAVAQGITTLPITRGSRGCVTGITHCTVKKWRSCARSGTGLIRA